MIFPTFRIWRHFSQRDVLISLAKLSTSESVRLYLVGGTVRDLIMDKKPYDLDFAVSTDSTSFARRLAGNMTAKMITLDEEQGTTRLIFNNSDLVMDFSKLRDGNIIGDLSARDFTINAMAIDFNRLMNTGEAEVIDPYNGLRDLNDKLIRFVSEQSVLDDPIRMLRAYRFAGVLGFTIDDNSASAIRRNSGLLGTVSSERIRDELFKLLAVSNSFSYLSAMDDVGLLDHIFPEIAGMKGMEQNEYHHLDVWGHSMLTLRFFEQDPIPQSLQEHLTDIEDYLDYELVKGRSRRSLLKLIALLHDVGKPATRTVDINGRIRFFDHHLKGAEISADIGIRLKLSRRETQFISNVVKYHMYPLKLLVLGHQSKMTTHTIQQFIQKTGSEWLPVLLISFADLRAAQGPWRKEDELDDMNHLISQIADICFKGVHMPPLITGDDLMKEFSLSPGPTIGELLRRVRSAQLDGSVRTRPEALELVRDVLSRKEN